MDAKERNHIFQCIAENFLEYGFVYKNSRKIMIRTNNDLEHSISFGQYRTGQAVINAGINSNKFYSWLISDPDYSDRIGEFIIVSRVGNTFKTGLPYKVFFPIETPETQAEIIQEIIEDALPLFEKFESMDSFCQELTQGKTPGIYGPQPERLALYYIWKDRLDLAKSYLRSCLQFYGDNISISYHESLEILIKHNSSTAPAFHNYPGHEYGKKLALVAFKYKLKILF